MAVIAWEHPTLENLAAPSTAIALLNRAIVVTPSNAALHAKLGNVHVDQFDFGRAALAFEAALRLDPSLTSTGIRLARAYNVLRRYADCLVLLDQNRLAGEGSAQAEIHYQRGIALAALDRTDDAEADFRAALACDVQHRRACNKLAGLLRRSGRAPELLLLCEDLAAKGVRHAQLLLDWGRAYALNGDAERAACLLLDPGRIVTGHVAPPPPFSSIDAFNAAFADELLINPFPVSDFPEDEEANRGSARVHHLACGKRPELVRALVAAIQRQVDAYAVSPPALSGSAGFDPWLDAKPARARLHAWGLIQRRQDYEAWHTHRGGWLSGVYYVRIPRGISAEGEGRGCIEYGPPPSLARAGCFVTETLRIAPCAGMYILAPSHYHHRTIPSGMDEYRISFAFDVVPGPGGSLLRGAAISRGYGQSV